MQADVVQAKYAQELHERIRREFPEVRAARYAPITILMTLSKLRIYKFFDRPVGELVVLLRCDLVLT